MQINTMIYILLATIIAYVISVFQYKNYTGKIKFYFIALRFLTILSILILIINPKFEKNQIYNEKPKLLIITDDSESVKHLGFDNLVNTQLNTFKNDIALNEKFDVEYYTFGNTLNHSDSLTFSSSQTNLANVFNELSQVYSNANIATILISDGNQTFGSDYEIASKKYDQPIYPVILGDTITYSDLRIQQLNVNKYAYLNNKLPVEIIAVYNGNTQVNSALVIYLNGTIVHRENLNFSKSQNSRTINLTLPANRVGVNSYRAEIVPLESEKNKVNNIKPFAVEVIDQKTNVAIISNISHPDLGALKKAIESNQQRKVSILKPNVFLEQIDDFQLAILYQPDVNFSGVYEAINTLDGNIFTITGEHTEWQFLNQIQETYKQEATSQTEDFLPSLNPNFSTFIVDDLDFESFPPLVSDFGETKFYKPYETLLFKRINDIEIEEPLLAILEAVNKREVILFGEGIWKWRAQSFLNQKSFQLFDNFIGKIIQYLASRKKRNRLNVNYEPFYNGNGNIKVTAQFFNKNYEFDANASLSIILKDIQSGEERTIPFILKQNNYEVDISGLPASEYNFTVQANNNEATQSGKLRVLNYNVEQQFLNANVTKLQTVATNSNGKSYFASNTTNLNEDLINDSRFVTLQRSNKNIVPLIDFKYLLIFIIFCLTVEWFLRKYNGLI